MGQSRRRPNLAATRPSVPAGASATAATVIGSRNQAGPPAANVLTSSVPGGSPPMPRSLLARSGPRRDKRLCRVVEMKSPGVISGDRVALQEVRDRLGDGL